MKGIVFNVLENYVDEKFGVGFFDDIVEKSLPHDMDPFVAPGTYEDDYLFKIIGKVIDEKGGDTDTLLHDFGRFMFAALAKRYPVFVNPYKHPKDFLLTVHDIIHVEVRKLFPEANTPAFYYSDIEEESMTLRYESKRNAYALAEGLIAGCGDYYEKPIQIKRVEYNDNEHYAIFSLRF